MPYTYRGQSDAVNDPAWSPDGRTVASASNDQTAHVWHYADGSKAFTYQGHSDVVNAVAWSSNGIVIASASSDKTVQEWGGV
jgi:WD40 repeat protein